ncbi:phage tail tape measure protein [Nonomuraea typhae]|uniref:phage tail tape measure protein n=1 Tax=Nonomuraea typhae TaxID=2603600 RepID=UPI0012FBE37E|nr:phage tail tape measure protein [Nonomuraea typhae]
MGRVVAVDLVGRDVTLSKTIKSARERVTDLHKTIEHANRKQRESLDALGQGAVVSGAALVAGFGVAVKATMEFDKAMSHVGAVSNASAKDLDGLRKAALQAGKDTKYSATEAAQAEAELAKVGISAADIMGGALKGALSLAAAGQLELEEAATLSGQAMKIFNLQGKDVERVADALAAGANKSAADVHQLGESLKAGGQMAAQAGLDLEDTVGVLAAFSDNALIGSDAGTSLKTMLMHLANPTNKSADLMEELGLFAYNAQGSFVGLEHLAGQLKDRLGGLTQQQRDAAMAQIFGSDAMRGAAILYKIGAEGVRKYTDAVSEQGAASKVAAKNMDNLAGDLEKLKGSVETALIEGGSASTGVLRRLVQAADSVVNAFSAMPSGAQGAVVSIAGVAGAASLAAGGLIFLIPKIAETKAAMLALGITADGLKAKLATLGKALALIAATVIAVDQVNKLTSTLAGAHVEADQLTEDLKKLAATGKLSGKMSEQWTGAFDDAADAPKRFGDAIREIADPTLWERLMSHPIDAMADALPILDGNFQQLQRKVESVDKALAAMATSGNVEQAKQAFGKIAEQAKAAGVPVNRLAEVFPLYTAAANSSVAKTNAAAVTQQKLAADSQKAAESIDRQRAALDRLNNALLESRDGELEFEEALDNVTSAFKENGAAVNKRTGAFNIDTAAGRANERAVIAAARAARDHALKVFDQTKSAKDANEAFKKHIEKLVGVKGASKEARQAIKDLIAKYIEMPKAINDATDKIKTPKKVQIKVSADGTTFTAGKVRATIFAKGGEVPMQPGGSRHKDSVHAMLRVGEHVWTPEEVDKVGGQQAMLRLRQMVRSGRTQLPAFAQGGPVGYKTLPTPYRTGPSLTQLRGYLARRENAYQRMTNAIGTFLAKEITARMGGVGLKAVQAARTQIGVPYSWGGGGPGGPGYGFAQGAGIRGFDCSSLMQYGWYKASGKVIPRTTYGQWPWTSHISKPAPGDLGFTSWGRNGPGHVVMYSGPGRVIQAPFTGARVNEGPGSGYRWGRPPIGRWRGGRVQPGQAYMVGERGPEMLHVGSPGRIQPSAGGLTITGDVHFHGVSDIRAMVQELQTYAKNTGGITLKLRT